MQLLEGMQMSTQKNLEQRMSHLEKEVRIWRRLGLGGLVCAVLVSTVAATQNPETPSVVRAKEFQLIGSDGTVKGAFKTLGPDNVQLRMNGATSEIALVANDQRATLNLSNDNRINSAVIEAYAKGGSMGLSRTTEKGRSGVHVNGGSEDSFVKIEPMGGPQVRIPE
ncbi:hypothetical protein NHH03_24265 [Stieleria sp. TO1_6]|uniref:hypothetical protein n=1 Tax=Stieleria tagensis TaxID=2956795 RepID=UPI00209B83D7|nr:hypothetical protein [Stieleria tagensis]MCO8124874.1 hypothetical protein [Stieleria tagensis]